jgi:hypothetical protein
MDGDSIFIKQVKDIVVALLMMKLMGTEDTIFYQELNMKVIGVVV